MGKRWLFLTTLNEKVDLLVSDPELSEKFAQIGKERVIKNMGPERMFEGFMTAIRQVHVKCSRGKNLQL